MAQLSLTSSGSCVESRAMHCETLLLNWMRRLSAVAGEWVPDSVESIEKVEEGWRGEPSIALRETKEVALPLGV